MDNTATHSIPGDQLQWHKSSFSSNGDCVEVAELGDVILIRDSKHPAGPVLAFTKPEMDAFVAGAKAGEFS